MGIALVERDGPIAIVKMNRPESMNSISHVHTPDIVEAIKELERDGDVGAIVLTGAGRGFCAGGDRDTSRDLMLEGNPVSLQRALATMHELIHTLRESPLPVVAAVHGPAFGAGFSVALAADLVVATRDARFCMIFNRLDVAPDLGAAWLLTRVVGNHRAKELIMLADEISGEEAERLGIVNRLVDTQEEMLSTARELALRLAGVAPHTRALTKSLINRGESASIGDSLAMENYVQTIVLKESAQKFLAGPKRSGDDSKERGKP